MVSQLDYKINENQSIKLNEKIDRSVMSNNSNEIGMSNIRADKSVRFGKMTIR